MSRLVFLLEEPSAREFLRNFLPGIGFHLSECLLNSVYSGKQDLLKCFAQDLRRWGVPGDQFIVMLDQDKNDCRELKGRVLASAREKCQRQSERLRARVVCRELEAWYLGDLSALRCVYPEARKIPELRRDPDDVGDPKPSKFLSDRISDFSKWEAAAKMGEILGRKCDKDSSYYDKSSPNCNRSASFRCFASTMCTLRELRGE